MAEMTYQQRSNQSTRMAVNQQRSSGRVLQDNRAAFKQSTQLKTEQPAQRLTDEEELQGNQPAQRVENKEEDEALQKKSASVAPVQREEQTAKPNNTGLPDNLKSGIENLSGMSMDGVKVHYNSAKPAQLNALAYAQGTDIHVASGQEKHLPHEVWHVVQQAQGRVKPTMQMKGGVPVNDDKGLEREADVMGGRAVQMRACMYYTKSIPVDTSVIQMLITMKEIGTDAERSTGSIQDLTLEVQQTIATQNIPNIEETIIQLRRSIYARSNSPVQPLDQNHLYRVNTENTLLQDLEHALEVLKAANALKKQEKKNKKDKDDKDKLNQMGLDPNDGWQMA